MSTRPFANPSLSFVRLGPDVNGALKFSSAVQASLIRQGYPAADAASYSQVYRGAFDWVQNNWEKVKPYYDKTNSAKTAYDAYVGAKTWNLAGTLAQHASEMGASPAIQAGFSNVRMGGGAAVLSGLVDVMQIVAKRNNVELNSCSMSIAKVSLDLAGMAAGGLSAETGFGAVLLVMSAAATIGDMAELGQSCGKR